MECKYFGKLDENGRKEGPGTFIFSPSLVYTGEFVSDIKQGSGSIALSALKDKTQATQEDLVKFSGTFDRDELNGEGSFIISGISSYKGSFLNGEKHGFGIFENGEVIYKGSFEMGSYHGEGDLFFKNESRRYEGRFEKSKMVGEMKVYAADQENWIYKGELLERLRHGKGEARLPLGRYTGDFAEDRIKGEGELSFNDSDFVYRGSFADGGPLIVSNTTGVELSKKGSKDPIPSANDLYKVESEDVIGISIRTLFQGPKFKNPEFEESQKKGKTKVPEFIVPDLVKVTQESGRLFQLSWQAEFGEKKIFFPIVVPESSAEIQAETSPEPSQPNLDSEQNEKLNQLLTAEGEGKLERLFLDPQMTPGQYTLSISEITVLDESIIQRLPKITLRVEIIPSKKQKKKAK